jgi:uncharacterized protein with HEPN domain
VSRDPRLYIEDMLSCTEKVARYVDGQSSESFAADERTYDAVVRNLEIMGEAAKRIPTHLRDQTPDIPWRRLTAFRDVLAHGYVNLGARRGKPRREMQRRPIRRGGGAKDPQACR